MLEIEVGGNNLWTKSFAQFCKKNWGKKYSSHTQVRRHQKNGPYILVFPIGLEHHVYRGGRGPTHWPWRQLVVHPLQPHLGKRHTTIQLGIRIALRIVGTIKQIKYWSKAKIGNVSGPNPLLQANLGWVAQQGGCEVVWEYPTHGYRGTQRNATEGLLKDFPRISRI